MNKPKECSMLKNFRWKIQPNKASLEAPKWCERKCSEEKFKECLLKSWKATTGQDKISVGVSITFEEKEQPPKAKPFLPMTQSDISAGNKEEKGEIETGE